MPNVTPTWGLTYPCHGEVVNPASFAQLNADIEAALATLDALELRAARRPYQRWTRSTSVVIPAGATGLVVGQTQDFAFQWPSLAVAPVKGLYYISYQQSAATGFTTATAETITVAFGTYSGTLSRTWNNVNSVTEAMNASGVVPLLANETINVNYSPFGTGNFTVPEAALSAHLICTIP